MIRFHWLFPVLLFLSVACTPAQQASVPPAGATPTVTLETILPPDAIRALEAPPTVPAAAAAAHIGPQAQVIGLAIGAEARAYPLGLMSRYELANDTLGGEPIAVTFCPLCNSGATFSRAIPDGQGGTQTLTFGISGKLLDGALVMQDRETGSLWAQSRLVAVAGERDGVALDLLTANQMPWQEWVKQHPDTTLVVDPRASRAAPNFAAPTLPRAGAATPNTVLGYVLGIATGESSRAYPLDAIQAAGVVNDAPEGAAPLLLVPLGEPGAVAAWQRTHAGQTLTFRMAEGALQDAETGSTWNPRTGIAEAGPLAGAQLQPADVWLTHWLGWFDLYPETSVWQG